MSHLGITVVQSDLLNTVKVKFKCLLVSVCSMNLERAWWQQRRLLFEKLHRRKVRVAMPGV